MPAEAPPNTPQNSPRPTHARHWVLVFAAALAVICAIDRACIATAAPEIRKDLSLNEEQWGWIGSVFVIAYAWFEIPMGRLGDRHGPRSVLLKVVAMWTVFTAATGRMWSYPSMLVCRFLFGVGEAGCFPNLTKIFTIWLPHAERGRAQGLMWLSFRWGAALTPIFMAWLMTVANWRWAFVHISLIGLVWLAAFAWWFRDRPRECKDVNAAELALLDGAETNSARAPAPWRLLLRRGTVWLLLLQYFCMCYGWYFYITWLPTYLREARGLDLKQSALLAGVPLFFGGVGCLAGGWLVRGLAGRAGVGAARRIVAGGGLLAAGAAMFAFRAIADDTLAIFVLGLASFSVDLAMASGWGACMDVGGRHAGALSGSMNTMNVGGAVSSVVVGYILEWSKPAADAAPTMAGWTEAFLVTACVYLLAAAAWLFIDPVTPLEKEAEFRRN